MELKICLKIFYPNFFCLVSQVYKNSIFLEGPDFPAKPEGPPESTGLWRISGTSQGSKNSTNVWQCPVGPVKTLQGTLKVSFKRWKNESTFSLSTFFTCWQNIQKLLLSREWGIPELMLHLTTVSYCLLIVPESQKMNVTELNTWVFIGCANMVWEAQSKKIAGSR